LRTSSVTAQWVWLSGVPAHGWSPGRPELVTEVSLGLGRQVHAPLDQVFAAWRERVNYPEWFSLIGQVHPRYRALPLYNVACIPEQCKHSRSSEETHHAAVRGTVSTQTEAETSIPAYAAVCIGYSCILVCWRSVS